MKRSEAFPSKYLAKDDVDPPIVGTIRDVKNETLKGDDGDESKPAMYFQESSIKPLLLNNSNWFTCEDLFGEDSEMWRGKQIEIYKDPSVMFGGKRVGGVRVRAVTSAPIPALKPTEDMWTRYKVLWAKAADMKLTDNLEAAPADISAVGLAEKGKALRALIEASEF